MNNTEQTKLQNPISAKASYNIANEFDDNKTYAIGVSLGYPMKAQKPDFDFNHFSRVNPGVVFKSEGAKSFLQFLQENPYKISNVDVAYTLFQIAPDFKYLAQGSIQKNVAAPAPPTTAPIVVQPSQDTAGLAGLSDRILETVTSHQRELYDNISRAKDNENQTLRGLLDQNNITNISAPFMQIISAKDEQINLLMRQIADMQETANERVQQRDDYWSEKMDAMELRLERAETDKNHTLTGFEAYKSEKTAEEKMHEQYKAELEKQIASLENSHKAEMENKSGLSGLDMNAILGNLPSIVMALKEVGIIGGNQTQSTPPQYQQNPNVNYQYNGQPATPQNTLGLTQEQLQTLAKLPPDQQRDVMIQILNEKNAGTINYEAQPNIVG